MLKTPPDLNKLTKSELHSLLVLLTGIQGIQSELVHSLFRQLATLSPEIAEQALSDFSNVVDMQLDLLEAEGVDSQTLDTLSQVADDLYLPLMEQVCELQEKAQKPLH
ncbi:hypothetical protein KZ405_11405 [Glaesserella parasuis]|nr:hypothetical protein [Glaesserella parasuis]